MAPKSKSIRSSNILRYWTGSSFVAFGGAINATAIPLIALFWIDVSPLQLGILTGIEQVAWLLFGLPAGVWVDRLSRKRVWISALSGRALLIGAISLSVWLEMASFWSLLVLGLLVDVCEVFGAIARGALVAEIATPSDLAQTYARVESLESGSDIGGSAIVGPIIAVLGAPAALLLDSLACLGAAGVAGGIQTDRRLPDRSKTFWDAPESGASRF